MSEAQPDPKPLAVDPFSVQTAPILYFDSVPISGNNQGIMTLMLAVKVVVPSADGQMIDTKPRVVAHLRCTAAVARHLRDTIDRIHLLGAETQGGKN